MFGNDDVRKIVLLVSNAPFPELLLGRAFCNENSIALCQTSDQIKELVAEKPLDIIFIDYATPKINLLFLTALLKNHDNTKTTPIYVLDTQGDPLNRTFCKEVLGVDGYITGSIPLIPSKPQPNPTNIYELDW